MSELNLTPEQATAVLLDAKKDKLGEGPIYEGSVPESPGKRVEVATELVGFAIDAYTKENMRGEEVTDLLKLAGVSVNGDGAWSHDPGVEPDVATDVATPVEGQTETVLVTLVGPDGAEVSVPDNPSVVGPLEASGFTRAETERPPSPEETPGIPQPSTPIEPEGNPLPPKAPHDPGEIQGDPARGNPDAVATPEEPWEDYDNQSAVDVKATLNDLLEKGELTTEMLDYVREYESGLKAPRKRIITYVEKTLPVVAEGAQPATDPEPDPSTDPGPAGEGHRELDAQADEAVAADEDAQPSEPIPVTPGKTYSVDTERHGILSESEAQELARSEIAKSGLPIPTEIQEAPDFPEDLTECDNDRIAQLHSQFNACLALANWRLGLVQIDERAWKHIAEKRKLEHVRSADPHYEGSQRTKAQDRIEAEAEMESDVQEARDKQYAAYIRRIPLQKLSDTYQGHVEALSRHWTMRQDERQYSTLSNREA